MLEEWKIKGHIVEYDDEDHTYIVDNVEVPSITTIMKIKFGNKYDGVDEEVLQKASERGTMIHNIIENYCKTGEEANIIELTGLKFLQKHHHFDILENEIPIILFDNDKPIACGRLDMVLLEDGKVGLGDLKTTYELDIEYLEYQLNLYRLGYEQCYDDKIEFLRGIHLRKKEANYVEIDIDENKAKELINEYMEVINNGKIFDLL